MAKKLKKIRSPLKLPGSKYYLSEWIVSNFPKNYTTFIDPFVGSGGLFLNTPKVKSEIINDLNPNIVNLFGAIRDNPDLIVDTLRLVKIHNEKDFLLWQKSTWIPDLINLNPYIYRAIKELVLRRFSVNGLGKHYARSNRLRRGMPEYQSSWLGVIENIPKVSERLQGVKIHQGDALSVIRMYNYSSNFLLYADPPYVLNTRTKKLYDYEVDDEFHEKMAEALFNSKARWIVSGYESSLYNKLFAGCRKVEKEVRVSLSTDSRKKKKEILWMNY